MKTNLSKCRRLNLALEPYRTVQMIRIDCKQICHTRPSSSSTVWPKHVILILRKKLSQCTMCTLYSTMPLYPKCPWILHVCLCIWYRGISGACSVARKIYCKKCTLCSGPYFLSTGQPLHMIRIDCKTNCHTGRSPSQQAGDHNKEFESGLDVKIL